MKEKRKKAVALKYDQNEHSAPLVTASGKGIVADELIKRAKDNNVPIVEDATLTELLANLNINEKIPEDLYEAVAEVFAFIYQMDKEANR